MDFKVYVIVIVNNDNSFMTFHISTNMRKIKRILNCSSAASVLLSILSVFRRVKAIKASRKTFGNRLDLPQRLAGQSLKD